MLLQDEKPASEDVEMLRFLASHVAVAPECALARDCAGQYQRELASAAANRKRTILFQAFQFFATRVGKGFQRIE